MIFMVAFFQEGLICLWGGYLDFGDCGNLVFAFADFRIRHQLSMMQHHCPDYRKRQGIFALNASKRSAIFHKSQCKSRQNDLESMEMDLLLSFS